jgi:hypothetical protein
LSIFLLLLLLFVLWLFARGDFCSTSISSLYDCALCIF